MTVSILLTAVLFLLMASIGRKKGIKSFFALFLNLVLIAVTILLICWQFDVAVLIVVNLLLILLINLFFINGENLKTVCAFLATSLTLIILVAIIIPAVKYGMIQGFGEEQQDTISGYTLSVGINFQKVAVYILAIASIGAIIDVAMSVSSAMYEMIRLNPRLSAGQLRHSGMKIGRDILGTTTNTLYFAFIGGYLTLMIWFKMLHYGFGAVLNAKVFASEVLSILSGAIGVVIVIPVTASLGAWLLLRKQKQIGEQ
ncbi:MAG: YibE/F family protein [Sporolactobacillus sp.]|jgi:uncharacterized membrane protein|nr:YibE/F family protein [Sporolactobacillus sp.]